MVYLRDFDFSIYSFYNFVQHFENMCLYLLHLKYCMCDLSLGLRVLLFPSKYFFVIISIFIIEVGVSSSTSTMTMNFATLLATMNSSKCSTLQGLLQISRVDYLIHSLFMWTLWTHQSFNYESEDIIYFSNHCNNIINFALKDHTIFSTVHWSSNCLPH